MTDEPKELTLADVDRPIIAIVALKSQREAKEQMMPHMHLPYYQVTIDPGQCRGTTNGYSPSGNFIRFGYAQGDELTGWQPAHEIEIFEIVAEIEPGERIYPNLLDDMQPTFKRVDLKKAWFPWAGYETLEIEGSDVVNAEEWDLVGDETEAAGSHT